MQRSAGFPNVRERRMERFVLGEASVFDRTVDARDVLVDHAAGADVEVTNLAIAHQPARQTDIFPARRELRRRVALA